MQSMFQFHLLTGNTAAKLQKDLTDYLRKFSEEYEIKTVHGDFQMAMNQLSGCGIWYAILLTVEFVEKKKGESIDPAKKLMREIFPGIIFKEDPAAPK